MSYRVERFTSTLKQSLADILLYEVQNPHLKEVVITDVLVSPDLKIARVFVHSTSPGLKSEELIRHLEHARGFIKKNLTQKMVLKYMPELYFLQDDRYGRENEEESR